MENSKLHPALKLLSDASKAFPGAWHYADFVRSQGKGFPKNCYLPIEHWEPHLEHCGRPKLQSTAMQAYELSLLGGWRPRQDIVTVPPFLYQALFTTDMEQTLNGQVFRRLPAWTVFFDLDAVDSVLYGFFAGTVCGYEGEELFAISFLPKPEYESLLDGTRTLSFKICDLPLLKAIEAERFCPEIKDEDARLMKPFLELFMPMISVTMFLCVYGFDGLYEPSAQRRVSYPQPKHTKKGWRLFPPPKPTVHELGTAIEARLAEGWQAVADECALISSSYDDADRAFRAVYGMPMPDKVQPDPFTATTADGSTIDLPGWYFPISVDSALSPEIGDKQEVSAMKDSPDFTALGPSIRRGFTHARTGTGKATALRFAVFEQALWDQWRMIEMGPIVRDLDRLMRNKQWRHAFEHAFGPRYYEQMRQWLKYTARPSQERQDVVNRTFSNFRSASTIFSLGLNVQTFIRQFGGYPQAIPDVGAGWIVRGLGKAFLNPRALWQEVNRLSPMMADRDKSFVRELREYTAKYKESKVTIAGHDFTRQDVQECAMALVTLGDRMTTYPIWWGAYQRAIQKHAMTQEKAVAYADGIVSKTQAVASEADINAWQRDNGFKRLLSMFMSESLRKGSRMRYWYRAWRRGQVPFSEYAWHFSNETFGVALLFLVMKAALTSSAPDKDDVAWAVFDEALGPIPMLNQLSSVMQYNTSPSSMSALKGFDLIGRTFQKGKKWAENPRDSDAIEGMFKAAVDMAAFTAGTGNVRRVYETAAEGWKDVSTGKSQNPFRMFLKGFDKDKR